MLRALAAVACLVVAAGTPGGEACAAAAGSDGCAPALVRDHSLLQVHPAAKVVTAKEHNSTGDEQSKASATKLQQEKAVQGDSTEKQSLDGKVDGGLESESGMDPYPEDYDLDTDYPRDDKGTHADTMREVQSATLPGAGDVGKNTKPGLSDSWNVDQMFVSDSDGGGHVSLRGMIPWGYRSQNKVDDNSGLLSEKTEADEEGDIVEETANEDKDEKMSRDQTNAAPTDDRNGGAEAQADEKAEDKLAGLDHKTGSSKGHGHDDQADVRGTAALPEARGKADKEATEKDEDTQKGGHKDEREGDAHAAAGRAKGGPDATAALPEKKGKADAEAAEKDEDGQKDGHKDEAEAESEGEGLDLKTKSPDDDEEERNGDAHAAKGRAKDGPDATAALPEKKGKADRETAEEDEDGQKDGHKGEAEAESEGEGLDLKTGSPDDDEEEREGDVHAVAGRAKGRAKDGPDATAALPEKKGKADREAAEEDEDGQKDGHKDEAKGKARKEAKEKEQDKQNDDHKGESEGGGLDQITDSPDGHENEDEDDAPAAGGAKKVPNVTAALPEAKGKAGQVSAEKDEEKQKDGHKQKAKAEKEKLKTDSPDNHEDENQADVHAAGEAQDGPDATAALPEAKGKARKEAAEKDEDDQKDHEDDTDAESKGEGLHVKNGSPGGREDEAHAHKRKAEGEAAEKDEDEQKDAS